MEPLPGEYQNGSLSADGGGLGGPLQGQCQAPQLQLIQV